MLEMLSEFARDLGRIDNESMTVLIVMVGWATLLVNIGVNSKTFTAIFIPGMFLGGLVALYLARQTMFSLAAAKDVNAILISVIGIIVGFLLTVLLMQIYSWLLDLRRPLTANERV